MRKYLSFSLIFTFCIVFSSAAIAAKKPSKKDMLVTITTSFGEMKLVLFEDTPRHRENFLKLAKEGFYNNTTFHRVINDFMIQGGDANSKDDNPINDGAGDIGYRIPAEILPHRRHVRGSVAAARNNNPQKQSSGSQFYIVQNHKGVPHLDDNYTVFGQVVAGLDVIDKIAGSPTERMDRPVTPIPMTVKVEKIKKKKVAKLYGYQYPAAA